MRRTSWSAAAAAAILFLLCCTYPLLWSRPHASSPRGLRASGLVVIGQPTEGSTTAAALRPHVMVHPTTQMQQQRSSSKIKREVVDPTTDVGVSSTAASTPLAMPHSAASCCSLTSLPPLHVNLTHPIKMGRPIRILFRTGNYDGPWTCDVPCEYTTNDDDVGAEADGKKPVDVVVGEAGPPSITSAVRAANPAVATAARSMESAVNYPSLKRLHDQVDAPMTTSLQNSAVPVIYLTRSSIAKWGAAPVVWNESALAAHFGAGAGGSTSSPRSSACFVARNCHSKNGRESAVKRLSALLPGGVDRPGMCLNTLRWPSARTARSAASTPCSVAIPSTLPLRTRTRRTM